MVNMIIAGPNGKMGRAMVALAARHPDIGIVGGVGPRGRDYIGQDIGLVAGVGKTLGSPVVDDLASIVNGCDVVLECTRPDVSLELLAVCREAGKALVTGTTGFNDDQRRTLRDASETIPVLLAANTSPAVHLLFDLLRRAVRVLGRKADIDVLDYHGAGKPDSPSGTALEIGALLAEELNTELGELAEYGAPTAGPRPPDRVRFHSVRAGGIPSSHRIVFGLPHERLELVHHAYSMSAFAEGMIRAGMFLRTQPPGWYDLSQALADSPATG